MLPDSKANILLVDDHPENLVALEAILDKLGQNLVKAHSGQEALRCLLNQDFAVILLDVQMPVMDGFETATLIRERDRSRHTPIIFLTAFSANDTLAFKGYALGAVDYLLKPIDPAVLTSKVAVFVDLFKKNLEVKHQAAQLSVMNTELRQSERRFRSLCACSPIGIFLTDPMGHCTYTNPYCQAICGFDIGERWQEGWSTFIYDDDRDRVLTEWSHHTHRGWAYSAEFRLCKPDGTVRWVHIRTSPLESEQSAFVGHVGTIEDITERKEAEAIHEQIIREQIARQQAEDANRMKDEFLAIVSHELRTPLNSILGWSQMLLKREFEPAKATSALKTIERNAKSQSQLIDDILDVSRILQDKIQLKLQIIDLETLIESVITTFRPLAEESGIQLIVSMDGTVPKILGDPERIRQVVRNLLSNAIKFTPESGYVEVELATVDHQVQLRVTDTGIGIDPDFLPYVFDRFRQADSSTTRTYGGLGLGLSIVRQLVELHQGHVSVSSDGEGKGATFTVCLPIASASPLTPSAVLDAVRLFEPQNCSTESIPSLDHLHILVVEDDTDTRTFLTLLLEQAKAQVTSVASAAAAMQALEEFIPHVLLSDIGMPDEDGYQLIRKVREFAAQRGVVIPAIALTAYAKDEDQQHAIAAGFQMYLAKPVEGQTLLCAIDQLVSQIPDRVSNSASTSA
jgi:hypothetical protein